MTDEVDLSKLTELLDQNSALPPQVEDSVPPAGEAGVTESGDNNADGGEEDAEERRRRKKKDKKNGKKRRHHHRGVDEAPKRSKYIDDIASSGAGSDQEDARDDAEDGTEDGFSESANDRLYANAAARRNYTIFPGDEEMTDAEVERHYQERYRALNEGALSKTQKHSLRYASRFLPTEKDPKVFAIKCRPRMNRVLVARIVNKCYAYRIGNNFEHKKMDLGIISVFCLDHVKEYIYVEAYRKLFVENAINGLEGLFRFRITVVDPSDLMKMMEYRPAEEKTRIGSLVRLRQRFYRNDLAQVTAVHSDGLHITVKVVPREDFVGKPFNKATSQLPARFFSPSLAVDVDVSESGGYRWGEYQFDAEGYLLKTVSSRMVFSNAQMEPPTAEELARFYNNNRERVREAVARTIAKSGAQTSFLVGDSVCVTTGQLAGTVGTILSIVAGDNTAVLSCKAPGRRDPLKLKVELAICAKHFMEGTHIIIDNGEYAGEGGTVLRSMGDVVLVLPDRDAMVAEIKVKANDCHQSKLLGTSQHKVGVWQVFDLVSVSDTSVAACIVRLSNTNMDVITERNETRTLTFAQAKPIGRDGGPRQTVDRMQNRLARGEEVKIEKTPLTPFHLGGETGRIEQVYNRTLFVRCRRVKDNSGIVALDATCVLLASGRTTLKYIAPPKQLPLPQRRPHNATRGDVVKFDASEDFQSSEWHEDASAVSR